MIYNQGKKDLIRYILSKLLLTGEVQEEILMVGKDLIMLQKKEMLQIIIQVQMVHQIPT